MTMQKTYILYQARFFEIFKANCDNIIEPFYCDKQDDAMWYNERSRKFFDSAVKRICDFHGITVDELEFLTV